MGFLASVVYLKAKFVFDILLRHIFKQNGLWHVKGNAPKKRFKFGLDI